MTVSDNHKRSRTPYLSHAAGVFSYSYNPEQSLQGFPNDAPIKAWLEVKVDSDHGFVITPVPLPDDEVVAVLAHHVKDYATNAVARFEKSLHVGGHLGEEVIQAPFLRRVVIGDWTQDSPVNYVVASNETEVNDRADAILIAALRKYAPVDRDQEYEGFLTYSPNQAIKSVRWLMQAGEPAYTHITYMPLT